MSSAWCRNVLNYSPCVPSEVDRIVALHFWDGVLSSVAAVVERRLRSLMALPILLFLMDVMSGNLSRFRTMSPRSGGGS